MYVVVPEPGIGAIAVFAAVVRGCLEVPGLGAVEAACDMAKARF